MHYKILPDELMERLDRRWFAMLMAYWEVAPFGDEMQMQAKICETIAIANGVKSDGENLTWEDFMPSRRPVRLSDLPIQSSEEARANLRGGMPDRR